MVPELWICPSLLGTVTKGQSRMEAGSHASYPCTCAGKNVHTEAASIVPLVPVQPRAKEEESKWFTYLSTEDSKVSLDKQDMDMVSRNYQGARNLLFRLTEVPHSAKKFGGNAPCSEWDSCIKSGQLLERFMSLREDLLWPKDGPISSREVMRHSINYTLFFSHPY